MTSPTSSHFHNLELQLGAEPSQSARALSEQLSKCDFQSRLAYKLRENDESLVASINQSRDSQGRCTFCSRISETVTADIVDELSPTVTVEAIHVNLSTIEWACAPNVRIGRVQLHQKIGHTIRTFTANINLTGGSDFVSNIGDEQGDVLWTSNGFSPQEVRQYIKKAFPGLLFEPLKNYE